MGRKVMQRVCGQGDLTFMLEAESSLAAGRRGKRSGFFPSA